MDSNDLQEKLTPPEKFMSEQQIDLAAYGIDKVQAEILRASLTTFADDWNSPEMSLYDHYDAARTDLKAQ